VTPYPTENLKSFSCNAKSQQQNLTKVQQKDVFYFVSGEDIDTAIYR